MARSDTNLSVTSQINPTMLNSFFNGIDANKRLEAEDRRFAIREAATARRDARSDKRADARDRLAAARMSLADKRYEDGLQRVKDKELSDLQFKTDSLMPTDIDFTKTETVEDRDNVTGIGYDVDTLSEAGVAPELFMDKNKEVSDIDQTLLNNFDEINKMDSSAQKALELDKLFEKHDKAAYERENSFGSGLLGLGGAISSAAYNTLVPIGQTIASPILSERTEKELDVDMENREKQAAEFYESPKDKFNKKLITIRKVLKENEEKDIKRNKAQNTFDTWLKKHEKNTYGTKDVERNVDESTGSQLVADYIKKEEAKIDPKLSKVQTLKKKLAIRTRGNKSLTDLKSRLALTAEIQKEIGKENRKVRNTIKTDNNKSANKMVEIAEKIRLGKILTPREQKMWVADLANKKADTKLKNRKD